MPPHSIPPTSCFILLTRATHALSARQAVGSVAGCTSSDALTIDEVVIALAPLANDYVIGTFARLAV